MVIGVDAPLRGAGVPLLPEAFVEVAIEGREVDGVYAVPRSAVVDGNRVWLAGPGDELVLRSLEIGWREGDALFATGGLAPGDRIVLTPMARPVEGMPVEATVRSTPGSPGEGSAS